MVGLLLLVAASVGWRRGLVGYFSVITISHLHNIVIRRLLNLSSSDWLKSSLFWSWWILMCQLSKTFVCASRRLSASISVTLTPKLLTLVVTSYFFIFLVLFLSCLPLLFPLSLSTLLIYTLFVYFKENPTKKVEKMRFFDFFLIFLVFGRFFLSRLAFSDFHTPNQRRRTASVLHAHVGVSLLFRRCRLPRQVLHACWIRPIPQSPSNASMPKRMVAMNTHAAASAFRLVAYGHDAQSV
jgi:hypothetical protein